jgi:hypothetical protein
LPSAGIIASEITTSNSRTHGVQRRAGSHDGRIEASDVRQRQAQERNVVIVVHRQHAVGRCLPICGFVSRASSQPLAARTGTGLTGAAVVCDGLAAVLRFLLRGVASRGQLAGCGGGDNPARCSSRRRSVIPYP